MTETARHSSMPRDPVSLVVGATAAQVIGGLVPQMSPFVIGGLMDGLSLSEREAGLIASIEFLALAVTAIAIAPVLPRFSYRRVGLVAVVLTLLAQSASIFSASAMSLALLRGLAGIGEGALYAVSLSIVCSRSSNPDKVYGYFQVVWALGSVALFTIGGHLTAAFAHRGIFALIAGVTLALAPLLLLIPDARAKSSSGTAGGHGAGLPAARRHDARVDRALPYRLRRDLRVQRALGRARRPRHDCGRLCADGRDAGRSCRCRSRHCAQRALGTDNPYLGVLRRLHSRRARALSLAQPDRLRCRSRRVGSSFITSRSPTFSALPPRSTAAGVGPRRRDRPICSASPPAPWSPAP